MKYSQANGFFEALSKEMFRKGPGLLFLLKGQLDNRMRQLEAEHQILSSKRRQLEGSRAILRSLGAKTYPMEVLVPLTSKLMVPARLDGGELMVHVGRGYFVPQTVPQAKEGFERRWGLLKAKAREFQASTILAKAIWNFANGIIRLKFGTVVRNVSAEQKLRLIEEVQATYEVTRTVLRKNMRSRGHPKKEPEKEGRE